MGIHEMVRGDTASFIETLDTLMTDLAESYSDDGETQRLKAQMLSNINSMMTDRHIVNKAFSVQFQNFRQDLFTKHLPEFDKLTEDEQRKVTKLHGMFCSLHALHNMGTAAAKALKVYEDIVLPEDEKITEYSFNKGNSRTFDLIFEISQSLTISGSQRFGRFADWDAFLGEHGLKNELVSFLRHRFNVLFVNGASVFYHRQHILDFLSMTEPNRLVRCILDSMHSPVCIAGVRALGIIAKLVTQPLWRVIERDNIHIFDLNPYWSHLQTMLKKYTSDATELLQQKCMFPEFKMTMFRMSCFKSNLPR